MLFLTGCGTIKTGNGFSVPVYSEEQRRGVVKELKGKNVPYTIEFMKDYKVLRDQARAK